MPSSAEWFGCKIHVAPFLSNRPKPCCPLEPPMQDIYSCSTPCVEPCLEISTLSFANGYLLIGLEYHQPGLYTTDLAPRLLRVRRFVTTYIPARQQKTGRLTTLARLSSRTDSFTHFFSFTSKTQSTRTTWPSHQGFGLGAASGSASQHNTPPSKLLRPTQCQTYRPSLRHYPCGSLQLDSARHLCIPRPSVGFQK